MRSGPQTSKPDPIFGFRRLNEHDTPLRYPKHCEVKTVSVSGHLAHEGKNYLVGEAFAHKRVGLCLNAAGQTELHFANVHLGHLAYDAAGGRFRPTAYVASPPRLNSGKGGSQAPSLKPSP